MRIKIYDHDAAGNATPRCTSTLAEAFPDDAQERQLAELSLRTYGRYWTGGGAAPLVLITPA